MGGGAGRWLPWVGILAAAIVVVVLLAANTGGPAEEAASSTTTTAAATTTAATTTAAPTPPPSTTEAPSGEPLSLASLLPITGDLAPFGPSIQHGVELAVSEVNEAGGVHGADVSFQGYDSGTSPDLAATVADEIVAGGYQAVVGAASSAVSLSVIDKLTGAKIVMVSPSNASPQFSTYPDGGFYFRTAPSHALQGGYTAALLTARGAHDVAIVYRADSSGEGLKDEVVKAFSGTVVGTFAYEPDLVEAKTLVANVKAADPGAILCICFPETAVPIHLEAFRQGLLKDDQSLPWFYTAGMLDPDFVQSLVDAGLGDAARLLAGFEGTAPGSVDSPEARAFAAVYQATYGEEYKLFAPNAYDAAWLVALAAEASDGTAEGIRSRLVAVSEGGEECAGADCLALLHADPSADVDYVGASGPIDFLENGDVGSAVYQVWTYRDDGTTHTEQVVSRPDDIR